MKFDISRPDPSLDLIGNVTPKRSNQALSYFTFGLLSIAIMFLCCFKPYWNWDMIPYVAAAKAFEVKDKEILHQSVYAQLRKSVPGEVYAGLVSTDYCARTSTDARVFFEQLEFYRIRILYTSLIYAAESAGIDPFFASHFISGIFSLVGVWLFLYYFRNLISPEFMSIVPAFGVLAGVLHVARASTPDAIIFMLTSLCICLCFGGNHRLLLAMLPVGVLVRTDFIIFGGLTILFVLRSKRTSRLSCILSLTASSFLYWATNWYFGFPGWKTVFYHTFISVLYFPVTTDVSLSFGDYFSVLLLGLKGLGADSRFIAFTCLVWISIVLFAHINGPSAISIRRLPSSEVGYALLTSIAYFVIHFLLFPASEARFFVAQYMAVGVVFLLLLTKTTLNSLAVSNSCLKQH